ncbi:MULTISPECIES: hypothetical protein [Pseudomonas]|uniref:hypothetical protein n=1 Tax=Pseudomonas TaxID=286 RepID=UPI001AE8C518|nr:MULTISPECIES: hypothetical protein [unclassified Pseudomonas]MBP1085399.1 hypothetical protein [Pseudomonas sp. PvP007]MBP1193564.1 hypothetical protein [Pseudomonas sp. PvP100]
MVEVLVVKSLTRPKSYDRRGRIFVDGHFVDFETELETFLALAVKYLKGNIKEVLLSDAEHPLFTLDAPHYEEASRFDGWPKNTVLLPARKPDP